MPWYIYTHSLLSSSPSPSSSAHLLIPSLKRPPLREKVSLQEELAVERAPELPVLETVAVRTAREEKKDSYELRVAMTQLSQWTPRLNGVSGVVCMWFVSMSCVHAVCMSICNELMLCVSMYKYMCVYVSVATTWMN